MTFLVHTLIFTNVETIYENIFRIVYETLEIISIYKWLKNFAYYFVFFPKVELISQL